MEVLSNFKSFEPKAAKGEHPSSCLIEAKSALELREYVCLNHQCSELKYVIRCPSGGLIDCPENALYYDWLLIDPIHSPFAAFRFHYRSWTNLRQLSLVLSTHEPEEISIPPDNRYLTQDLELRRQRPLPEIPVASLSRRLLSHRQGFGPATLSSVSYLTPCIEEELTEVEEVEVATAEKVPVDRM